MHAALRTLRLTTLVTLLFWLPNVPLRADLILTGTTLFDFGPQFGPQSIGLDLSVNPSSNVVDIFMSGRSDGWFAVGFDSTNMINTYAIIITQTGAPVEYLLQEFGVGNAVIAPTVSVIGSSVVGSKRTVHLRRDLDLGGGFPQHYVFPTEPGFVALAGATGPGAFNQHDHRRSGDITLFATAVPEPSSTLLVVVCAVGLFGLHRRFGYSKSLTKS